MGRPKKVNQEVESNLGASGVDEVKVRNSVSPLALEFGRDDLNKLRDKLNEVIEYLNQ